MFKWAIEPSLMRVTVGVNRNVPLLDPEGEGPHLLFFLKLYLGIVDKIVRYLKCTSW